MLKLFLIHPSPDKNRFGSKRRTRSSMAQINLPLLAGYADRDFEVRIIDSRFGSVGRQYAEMFVYLRSYKDITFLACAYIAETA